MSLKTTIQHMIREEEGNVDLGAKLMLIGVVLLFISVFVFAEVSLAIVGVARGNESLGTSSTNISSFTVSAPQISDQETVAVRNDSTTATLNNSFDSFGCRNVPCYTVNYVTGLINISLGYNPSDGYAGVNKTETDQINIDYTTQKITEDNAYNTATDIRDYASTAFSLVGISLIALGAAIVLGVIENF